jgi:hypothetical protein
MLLLDSLPSRIQAADRLHLTQLVHLMYTVKGFTPGNFDWWFLLVIGTYEIEHRKYSEHVQISVIYENKMLESA